MPSACIFVMHLIVLRASRNSSGGTKSLRRDWAWSSRAFASSSRGHSSWRSKSITAEINVTYNKITKRIIYVTNRYQRLWIQVKKSEKSRYKECFPCKQQSMSQRKL